MEDQDHWWLSGIHRDVWLYSKPNVAINDYAVTTDVHEDGTATIALTVSVTVAPATEAALHEAPPSAASPASPFTHASTLARARMHARTNTRIHSSAGLYGRRWREPS
jgi:beta-galactosidase/beta-glucuronidase